jgi:hypothetical protein
MTKFLASILTAFLLVTGFSGTAEANRPVPGYKYKDVCKNIPGKQTILDTVGITATYRFKTETPRPNDCERVNRGK